jgi:hypothetical protein
MNEAELSRLRRARLWIDEVPHGFGGSGIAAFPSLCIEVIVPKGPMMMYGLLGGSWDVASSSASVVPASIGAPVDEAFAAISATVRDVQVGAPDILMVAASAGASEQVLSAGRGELKLLWAAHSPTWSSQAIFRSLGEILAKAVIRGSDLPDLTQLLESGLP